MSQCYLRHEFERMMTLSNGDGNKLFFFVVKALDNFYLIYKKINLFTKTGFAYVGGACVVNKRLEKVNSVAIIEDTGGFSGIIVAAHEVGHL